MEETYYEYKELENLTLDLCNVIGMTKLDVNTPFIA